MSSPTAKIVSVRASVVGTGGAEPPWDWKADTKIASQMSRWPEFRGGRRAWGLTGPGVFIVEVETDDGHIGLGHSSGAEMGAFIVEHHLARFVEGRELTREAIEDAWEQMFHGTLHFGRRGVTLHAISAVDLALWDALGEVLEVPVWSLLGPRRHQSLPCYATTPRPDLARAAGFVGGKLPLPAGYAEGADGLKENLDLAREMRQRCGDAADFFLSYDCYMSLDVPSSIELAGELAKLEFSWIEEFLPPDDYWGYGEVRRAVASRILTATGEHEDTRWGFRLLLDYGCADILQPDLNWCGGLSEFLKIVELADDKRVRVIPHGGGVVAGHVMVTRDRPEPMEVVIGDPERPDSSYARALFVGDAEVITGGKMTVTDAPGFGIELNPAVPLLRPYAR